MKYLDGSIKDYLNDLAAKKPAPGGGSAAALNAAIAAALVSMVCNFTVGKDKYKAHEEKVRAILKQSETIRKELERLVDADVDAYNKVAKAGKAVNDKILKEAEAVPEQVCKLCADGMNLCAELVDIGNKNLISDVGVAAIMFLAAFEAADLNVKINLKFIKDREFSAIISSNLETAHRQLIVSNQRIGSAVNKIISG